MKKQGTLAAVFAAAIMAGAIWSGPAAVAAPKSVTTTTSTTSSAGTVEEISPGNFVIRSETGAEPYTYSESTTYVDESGAPVAVETVRSGAPVTVYYESTGGHRVAKRVVVHKKTTGGTVEERRSTTTTTTESNR